MKARIIKGMDFQASAPWTLDGQEKAISVYERRLIRLWRVGFLPHEICAFLGVSKASFVDKLESLSLQGVDLSPDHRCEPCFSKSVVDVSQRQCVSDGRFTRLLEDYCFYVDRGVKSLLIARLLECPQHYLKILKSKAGEPCRPVAPKLPKKERDKRICSAFLNRKGERGLKSSLAREFELSCKSIDLILADAGIDASVRAKRNIQPKPETVERDARMYEHYENKRFAVSAGGTNPRGLIPSIAAHFGVTTAYVYKVIKKHRSGV